MVPPKKKPRMRRTRGLVREIRRKSFHLSGLIIPALYAAGLVLTRDGEPIITRGSATLLLGGITATYFIFEILRLFSSRANEFLVRRLRLLMRRGEVREVTGTGYYLLGACFTVALFDPPVAIAAILFLVVGDPAAAIVGKAIGRIRILQSKTVEGSFACLATCFLIGLAVFHQVGARWPDAARLAVVGAIAAALVELLPLRINDNVTIPLISGLVLMLTATWLGVDVTLP